MIKEKLRKDKVNLPEIEHILEDKYQSMKNVKGGMMKKTTMLYLQATLTRESTKNSLREDVHTVESMDTKAVDCPNKKSNQNKGFKWKPNQK